MTTEQIFKRLWTDYTLQNPDVRKVYNLFADEGEEVVNDHVALRTFDHPSINVDVLSKVFLKAGYVEKGQYVFEKKHLFAKHFEHTSEIGAPRVFISQLISKDFSPYLQETVVQCVAKIPVPLLHSQELIFSGNMWCRPSYEIYDKLRIESEYAAWLYANGFTANHFTISVNHLKKYDTLQKVNDFLKANGFKLNDADGEIQGTPQDLLEQSSIRAGIRTMEFQEGTFDITGCYYEFAKRYSDKDGKLYSGFIARSADKIFQSTNLYKKD